MEITESKNCSIVCPYCKSHLLINKNDLFTVQATPLVKGNICVSCAKCSTDIEIHEDILIVLFEIPTYSVWDDRHCKQLLEK